MNITKNLSKTVRISTVAAAICPFAGATEVTPVEDVPASYSLSLEAVYANAFKRADRGGVDMGGADFRWNYNIDAENQFSLGLLMLAGSKNIAANWDLDTSNLGLLAGYRFSFPLVKDKLSFHAGLRVGIAFVDYTIDSGRTGGWDHYRTDSDFCAIYAGELGLSFALNEQWSIRGGYELYGNTAKIGGSDAKFNEQQYHLFQLGAEYKF